MIREFAKLLGGLHAKSSMAELSKIDRGNEVDEVKLSELFYGLYFRVVFIGYYQHVCWSSQLIRKEGSSDFGNVNGHARVAGS
nr:probable plastidic glucose transporter 2 [Tanacetum cinerariifolium]GFA11685.1 probable plastidic glucose transporter 2 [Tanacetum cinerariifolium]